jgi:hypothetical protein
MEPNEKLYLEDGEPLKDVGQYQRLVDKLIYLTVTRPDIAFAVSLVSQFMHAPKTIHLEAVDRTLRYLKGSQVRHMDEKNETNSIVGYSYADWAGSYDRKSTTRYCTFIGGDLMSWKNKKQNMVARSSAEAKYRAMASTVSKLIWIKQSLARHEDQV